MGTLNQLQSDAPTLADKLRTALTERFDNPEMKQRNEAIGNFFALAPQVRQEKQDLLSAPGQPARPTAVESLVSQRRGTALMPIMNLTNMMAARQGGIGDTIDRGVGAFQSLIGAQQGKVGLAQTNYQMALDNLVRQQQKMAAEQATKQQEFENNLALAKFEQDKKTAGSAGLDPTIAALLAGSLGNGAGTPTQTATGEPAPNFSPGDGPKTSPGGQWVYTNGKWQPANATQRQGFLDNSWDF